MGKLNKRVLVYISEELSQWLEAKAMEGYKKGALVRHILSEHMRVESGRNGNNSIR